MEAMTLYPGSIGEIVQGNYKGIDVLVSCPVNLFTKVRVYECKNPLKKYQYNKAHTFMKNILTKWNYEQYINNLDIEICSKIPIGKGFASSTADLCATYYSLLKIFNKQFNQNELMLECLKIEPTDSTIFRELTIFDYKNGLIKEKLGKYTVFYILVFEGNNIIDTIEFNNQIHIPSKNIDDLINIFSKDIYNNPVESIAKISTESIIRNQCRLRYNVLSDVLKIKDAFGGLGILGAHSGDMLGIIFDDKEKIRYSIKNAPFIHGYKTYILETLSFNPLL